MNKPRRTNLNWLKVALVLWLILLAIGLFGCGGGGEEEQPQTEEQRTAARITNQDRGDRQ